MATHPQLATLFCVLMLASSLIAAKDKSPFGVALENGDTIGAARIIDRAADQQGRAHRASQLDDYYGRFFAALGQGSVAEPYLRRAIAAIKDSELRDELAFELARAQEVHGNIDQGLGAYRRLTTSDTSVGVRLNAVLSVARLRLGASPLEAIALLLPQTESAFPAAVRWEAHLLLSRAYAILGRNADAKKMLDIAWVLAPAVPVPADAVAVTAMDMAIDKVMQGDRAGVIGLMAIDTNSNRFAGVSQIPVCDSSLTPDDFVTIAVAADHFQRPIYSAVRASRSGIAHLFTEPLALTSQRVFGSAFYVTLRCRTAPDSGRRFAINLQNLSSWLAENSFYPPLRPADPEAGDMVAQLRDQLNALETRVGVQSPVLAPVLLQLSYAQSMQGTLGNAERFANAKALADRAITILEKAAAPPEVIEPLRIQTTMVFAQNQNIAEVAGPTAFRLFDAIAARPTSTPAQLLAAFSLASAWQLRPTQRLTLVDQIIALMERRNVAINDPIRQVAELKRARIVRELGSLAGLSKRLSNSGLTPQLCSAADRPPFFPPAAITLTSEDYPKDLLRRSLNGLSGIEMSVDATGKVTEQRVIASQPAGLFDTVTKDKLRAATLLPAQTDGVPKSCIGMVQTVRWQIPSTGEFSPQFPQVFSTEEPYP